MQHSGQLTERADSTGPTHFSSTFQAHFQNVQHLLAGLKHTPTETQRLHSFMIEISEIMFYNHKQCRNDTTQGLYI